METDIRYYRRRACEEMGAARRAVTPAARERRLQMVDHYLQRLEALDAPCPFDRVHVTRALEPTVAIANPSAFDWPATANGQRA